ncbi:MAG: NAD(P)/FAD-dependent oxidoreductase, partial [Deltaproteobacteria bacterium]|nr:NAD(P)/FAD-dependent oxidoreductase [Deltaproteobacteria bacterium]
MVAVIGASSAGLLSAYLLASAKIPVQVLEARPEFEPEERTLIATHALCDILEFDFSTTILNRITNFRLHTKGQTVTIPVSKPDLVIERRALLKLLLGNASSVGAKILLGCKVKEVKAYFDHVKITAEKDGTLQDFFCDYVIVASGVQSVRGSSEIEGQYKTVGICQVRVDMPEYGNTDTVDIWFDTQTTKFFYWLIPEGIDMGVVGVIAETKEKAEFILDEFVKKNRMNVRQRQKADIVPLPPLVMKSKYKKDGRILFAGDSCAQVKATTVGGLVSGLKGGIACARSILAGRPVDEFLK